MPSLRDLPTGAHEVLDAFVRQLERADVEVPERRYVAPGVAVVWDGEQFSCNLQQIIQGQPGIPSLTTAIPPASRVFAAQWALSLVRAVPALETDGPVSELIPNADEIDEAGSQAMLDSAQLILAAQQIHEGYVLSRPGQGFAIDGCTTLGPEGGLAAARLLITVSLG
jgi:hypothetical protein